MTRTDLGAIGGGPKVHAWCSIVGIMVATFVAFVFAGWLWGSLVAAATVFAVAHATCIGYADRLKAKDKTLDFCTGCGTHWRP